MPDEFGGAGVDFVSYVLETEEIAYGDAGFCNMINATNSCGFKLRDFGSLDIKERFLRPVASGGWQERYFRVPHTNRYHRIQCPAP